MDKLYPILTQMKTSLDELEAIMIEEVNQLNRAQINPVSLQVLADNKNQLLTTIQYYDDMRRQQEQHSATQAPYPGHGKLFSSWQQVNEKVRNTKALNQQVESLLQSHMKKNQHIQKAIDHVGRNSSLYGPAGESSQVSGGHKYNISI
ncbi:flagella synthesis protein FlgN [Enterobacter ludwigii]|jgi:flagella synthesis protein FlgN|uniref:flagella synthesis protein FlgN n=1 Tax=Enterobacter ludwigii TaxID=299767 RepID=UPI0005CFA28C|nr:flagellar export chaperone FlgN [Enterobacter ludwigii]MCR5990060.1 flagella synthesis protein [Enterobacter ludwigii]UAK92129.1 flagellar export chaperone FlgN [Enterobacter ludwigii]UBH88605.1 flagellar export chaperone FlgN [Enterobacter ludwigii]WRM03222.1 flagellar export chaperone FlgN [Enterobacter ludwigii]HDR2513908.1 flagellar export chaperone FlgN [Enterobacter ludwigii]